MRLIRDSVYIFSFTRHETNPSQSARWRGRVERNRKRERERGREEESPPRKVGDGVGQGTRGGAKDVKQDARVEKRGEGSEKLRTSCDGNKSSVLPCTSFRVHCTRIYPLQPPSTLYHVARTRHSSRPKWNFVLAPRSVDARICVSNVVFHPPIPFIHPFLSDYPLARETCRSLSLPFSDFCQPRWLFFCNWLLSPHLCGRWFVLIAYHRALNFSFNSSTLLVFG